MTVDLRLPQGLGGRGLGSARNTSQNQCEEVILLHSLLLLLAHLPLLLAPEVTCFFVLSFTFFLSSFASSSLSYCGDVGEYDGEVGE